MTGWIAIGLLTLLTALAVWMSIRHDGPHR